MPPKSTALRLEHFDDQIYAADANTILFKFVDALCGDAGAGSLKKEIFLQRLSGALDSIYGSDLDYVFGNVRFLSRVSSESYVYDSMTQMLTSTQWDEVAAKDAQYRNRIREYFIACGHGNTAEGIRQVVHAATSADCQVMESWRYIDAFGISEPLGRAGAGKSYAATDLSTGHRVFFATRAAAQSYVSGRSAPATWSVQEFKARSEVTVVPHKPELTPREARLLLQMLDKTSNVDTVITVDPNGLSVHSPVPVRAISADSTYYQVEKVVTGNPVLDDLPAPELLAIDLNPSENWLLRSQFVEGLRTRSPEIAPYAQFNISQEYGYFYLVSGGNRSPIDEVSYGTLQDDNKIKAEAAFEWYEQSGQYGPWSDYEKADSPDNYPGGRFGLTPTKAPAINADRSPYQFPYLSQADYITRKKAEVTDLGGEANELRYRLPMQKTTVSKRSYTPDLAIAYTAPTRESTVTSSWTSRKPRYLSGEPRNPSLFVRG
jgi:hypothetical protein